MSKFYKEIGFCKMCKERFTIDKEQSRSKNYCPACCKKYFKPKKDAE